MKALISQKELDKAIQIVNRAAAAKSMIPALAGILIHAETGKLVLTANNHEIAIQHTVAAEVETPGKVLVSGRLLGDLVKKMPADDVMLKLDPSGNSLNVSSAGTSYNILTMKTYEFPAIEMINGDTEVFSLLASELRDIFKQTAFAVGNDEIGRPVFTGIHLLLKNQQLSAFATDTHRFALKRLTGRSNEIETNLIIPNKILADVTMVLDPDDTVNITWNANKIAFSTAETYLISRLISGKSPDFERIIPKNPSTVVTVNRDQLLIALERLSIVNLQRFKDYILNDTSISIKDDSLIISGTSREKGHAVEEMTAQVDGEPMEIMFNGTNIAECLKVLSSDKVIISLTAPNAPAMLVADNDDSFLYVFSPVIRAAPNMEAAS
ncbi:DNA polymerase III subunit beta [Sporomusa sp. KB1]|uniref:DNA polymerase III subunit beta n=1 Tax=Sporomusa sp. KB1 TaxID=943346 RepID=UPI0011ABDD00|nr:DNA polymerase III subunit beta [Sporomusa sp. KB1]TWH48519.1 DNA polymerase-3 subunit beta [Sporomusa sp. KB1]